MSLKYAILGVIDIAPSTGYDIKKLFDSSVEHYWTATHSQIYRTLEEIRAEGLGIQQKVVQEGLPNKNIFSITDKGREALQAWSTELSDLPAVRNKLLVQLSFCEGVATEKVVAMLQHHAHNLKVKLKELDAALNGLSIASYARSKREKVLWDSVIKNGIYAYSAELDWTLATIKEIEVL